MNEPELLDAVEGFLGRMTLNRPRALNALTLGMCRTMTQALTAWSADPSVKLVLIDHAGERGFCAGGDIRAVTRDQAAGAREFFAVEYRLNHLMFAYPKPIVTVMDGVTMGGGVGISAPARLRIATERTLWAMPETAIGLFPDIGAGWHLSRLPGEVGTWLALTGARLRAADLCALGLATHFAPSARLAALKAELAAGGDVARLDAYAEDPGPPTLAALRPDIDRLFAHDTMEEILGALEADGSAWALEQLARLRTMAPLSLKVGLRLLRQGRTIAGFAEEMEVETRLAVRISARPDFAEGVRALLIDRDNAPRWNPARLEAVDDALVEAMFAPLPPSQAWTPAAY